MSYYECADYIMVWSLYTVLSVFCAEYSLECTVYSAQYKVFSIECVDRALWSVPFINHTVYSVCSVECELLGVYYHPTVEVKQITFFTLSDEVQGLAV